MIDNVADTVADTLADTGADTDRHCHRHCWNRLDWGHTAISGPGRCTESKQSYALDIVSEV